MIDAVLGDYVTTYSMRAVRRSGDDAVARWTVDGDVMVELIRSRGTVRVVVHELGLVSDLRKQLRSHRVSVAYAGA